MNFNRLSQVFYDGSWQVVSNGKFSVEAFSELRWITLERGTLCHSMRNVDEGTKNDKKQRMIEPCHGLRHNSVPAIQCTLYCGSLVAPVGLPATIRCEPRQARKGAAATADSGAGERWAGVAIIPSVIVVILFSFMMVLVSKIS